MPGAAWRDAPNATKKRLLVFVAYAPAAAERSIR
jgi:hypothetical protein